MDTTSIARQIIDTNQYLTLATADGSGQPWASPVWYAHDGYGSFVWVSRPGARHSTNIAARAEVSCVIFDSTVPVGQGQAVYVEAVAGELTGTDRDRAVATFAARSLALGHRDWTMADVTEPAQFRIYRATVSATFVLDDHDQRVPVTLTEQP